MSERIVLKDAGSELVMMVRSVKPETVERNDYFLFSDGQREMLVPQSSVNAQLTRLELTAVTDLVNKGVKFSRSVKLSRAQKPYWDVSLATPEELKSGGIGGGMGTGNGSTPAAPVPAGGASGSVGNAPAGAAPVKSYTDIYSKATDFVLDKIVPKYIAKGLPPTAADVHAMVATLFIPKSKES